jgi:prephenate dehydratase
MTEVAYLGPVGTFSELAAKKLFPKATLRPTASVAEIGTALAASKTLCAVLPFQNSDVGFVPSTIEILTRRLPVFITGLADLPIRLSLYRLRDDASPLRDVLSHSIGLKQCEAWIKRQGLQGTAVDSTAAGPNRVLAQRLVGVGAVAPAGQAAFFGLEEVETDLQGEKPNRTRFVRLERRGGDGPMSRHIFLTVQGTAGLANLLDRFPKVRSAEIAVAKTTKSLGGFSYVLQAELSRPMATKSLVKSSFGSGVRLIGWTR